MPKFKTAQADEEGGYSVKLNDEFMKLMEKLRELGPDGMDEYIESNREYIKQILPPSTRGKNGPFTPEVFEEVFQAVKDRDWARYHKLVRDLSIEAMQELDGRLDETQEWQQVRVEEVQDIIQANRGILEKYSPPIREAVRILLERGSLRDAAGLANMSQVEFYQFFRRLNLKT